MERRINPFESQSQLMSLESFGDCERPNIAPSLIIVVRNMGGIDWEGVDHVRISGKSVAAFNSSKEAY
jgi:hypothetical protein